MLTPFRLMVIPTSEVHRRGWCQQKWEVTLGDSYRVLVLSGGRPISSGKASTCVSHLSSLINLSLGPGCQGAWCSVIVNTHSSHLGGRWHGCSRGHTTLPRWGAKPFLPYPWLNAHLGGRRVKVVCRWRKRQSCLEEQLLAGNGK